jgi:hypothetical protein
VPHQFKSVVPYTSTNGSRSKNTSHDNKFRVQSMLTTTNKDGTQEEPILDMYTYHLGRESMELCNELEPNDTGTQNWHSGPKAKCLVTIQFSLDDDEDDEVWKEQVEWNLHDPTTLTPVTFATNMAAEFGLSFGATMELAQSIQQQLDAHRGDAAYPEPPVTLVDYVSNENPRAVLAKSRPSYLYGNLNTNIGAPKEGGMPMKQKPRPKLAPASGAAAGAATAAVAIAKSNTKSLSRGSSMREFEFRTSQVYRDQVIQRARKECKFATPSLQLKYNHVCHLCGVMKRQAAMFPCHIPSHVYCQEHCRTECGMDNILSKPTAAIDYCPICCVSCSCLKCKKKLDAVAVELEKRCKRDSSAKQQPHQVKFDNILLYCAGRFPGKKASVGGKSFNSNLKRVPKVPRTEFPREMCGTRDLEPGTDREYRTAFTSGGAYLLDPIVIAAESPPVPPGEVIDDDELPVVQEDGNVDYCHICRKAGDLVCCDYCPRAFHEGCIPVDESNNTKVERKKWECHTCQCEEKGLPQDMVSGHALYQDTDKKCIDKVCEAFVEVKEPNEAFLQAMMALSMILEMVEHLIDYDFGYMFREPVDENVPGYSIVVKNPMDLGTISDRLVDGHYTKLFDKEKKNWGDVIARVLMDIELVWHNCFMFNFEGSSVYRMAEVQARRSRQTRKRSFDECIGEKAKQQVTDFLEACKLERVPIANLPAASLPKSKHRISASWAPGGKCRTVAVLDPTTNRITKLYTTLRSACAAALYLQSLGYATEWAPLSDYTIKTCIRMGKDDPKLTLFGHRWMFYDELRTGATFGHEVVNPDTGDWALQQPDGLIQMTDGQNTFLFLSIAEAISSWELPKGTPIGELTSRLEKSSFNYEWIPLVGFKWRKLPRDAKPDFLAGASKDHAAIVKVDSLSGRRLVGFDSVAAAHQDWMRACEASPIPQAMDLSLDNFQKHFLRAKKKVDGLVWKIMMKKETKPAVVKHKQAVAAAATQLGKKRKIEQVHHEILPDTPPAKVNAIEMVAEQLDGGTPMTSIVVPKGQCKACLIGPAYKKGHIITCPKSKSYRYKSVK